jgi:hypothetical protein
MKKQIYRAWINQPSTLQPLHSLHGTRCIAKDNDDEETVRIWFTSGEVLSMECFKENITKLKLSNAK